MRVVSWNVNGLRSISKKAFARWRNQCGADVVCVQETRVQPEQLKAHQRWPRGWKSTFHSAERKGYSGVATFSQTPPEAVHTTLNERHYDREGRLLITRFGDVTVANVYFPNGSGPNRDHSRVPYKLGFYRALFDHLEPLRAGGEKVLVVGDFNTAHRPIDLARPKQNTKTSGFLENEREELDRWLNSGWTDTFRHLHGDVEGAYTWWSQRQGVREKNIGWRLDLVLAAPGALPVVKDAFIWPDVLGSDHCPVGVDLAG
ncbi:MAG: exodeoxyribonuclease III [Myxococcales bacterium]|nr:exodeoxyribonuclease III [Myxococcales bacterium]